MQNLKISSFGAILACLILSACSQSEQPTAATEGEAKNGVPAPAEENTIIQIDGSSTVFPITEAVAEEFQLQHQGKTKVTVGVSGTGGGFKKFCRGELDIVDASRPIQKAEMDACAGAGVNYYEIPVAYDALTVVVNPGNTFLDSISVEDLKKIWAPAAQGTVTKWNQINPAWPDAEFKLYGAGADSGTFDYFTEAVVGTAKSSRGDYTASEDDNVLVQGVAQDLNALGYFGFAYYIENKDKLKALAIVPASGQNGVLPDPETVIDGSYRPLARPLFIYVKDKAYEKQAIKDFVHFYLENATSLVTDVKYIPLPSESYRTVEAHLAAGRLGTVFNGEPATAITIEELLKREASR